MSPRRNRSHRRWRQPVILDLEPPALTTNEMAARLVKLGLASPQILEPWARPRLSDAPAPENGSRS